MAERKHILFVDDEQNVLDGLRRMLHPMRSEWDMTFVSGGEEALDMLERIRCDIIVSDLRMPGMSGDKLLAAVRTRFPGVVRLVLSGQAGSECTLKSVGAIHQYLQKPCNEETLRLTLTRTMALGDLFADKHLKSLVTELESLPSLPSHHAELMAQFQTPGVSPKLIGESIGKDVAMSAKILQLVNSAFFGLRRHVGSPADAVMLLGVDTVRSLVLTMQTFSQVGQSEINGFSQQTLLSHSVCVADIAKAVATAEGMTGTDVENAYLAGLLHDVGKLVLAAKCPDALARAISEARALGITGEESERRAIGASHSEVGAYLLGLWGFESPVVDAALHHHHPRNYACDHFSVVTAVHIANAFVSAESGITGADDLNVDHEHLARIGAGDRLAVWWDAWPRITPEAA